jgi:lipoate-protein ligase A
MVSLNGVPILNKCRWISGIRRVKGGKTLKIDMRVCDGVLADIVISGDFFAHPEEGVDELEESLKNTRVEDVDKVLAKYRDKILFTGISFNDLEALIKELAGSM